MSTDPLAGLPDPLPVEPLGAPVDATVVVPGSKSITNRALVCAALAPGTSTLDGVLLADDTEAMLDCLTRLGIEIDVDRGRHRVTVRGTGGRIPVPSAQLDARLSGTTSRFLAPLLALGTGPYRLDGAPPLRARPMGPGLDALVELGATVVPEGQPGHLPVSISGGLTGGTIRLPSAVSSQFASGLLMAAPCLDQVLEIHLEDEVVSRSYLDLTAAVMGRFGSRVTAPAPRVRLVAPGGYRPADYRIEPDASAASYFFAAAAITAGRVRIDGLGTGSSQGDLAFVDVLELMGAEVTRADDFTEVRGTGSLRGVTVDMGDLSDTAQTLAAVAVFADGPTEVTGIGFIRRKETDRIAGVVTELQRCGIDAAETPDGFHIEPGAPEPAVIRTYDDHRMAMSFALLGLRAEGIRIADPACVAKTFPGYWQALDRLRNPDVSGD
ncbi:MAG: 3-phosphoshikimate 1-carboxyvinyltransferase [Acidimicrobiales bacterium]